MLHLPILRHGVPYRSLDVVRVPHHRTREPFVEISQANAGLIRRDLLTGVAGRGAARRWRPSRSGELLEMCAQRGDALRAGHAPGRRRSAQTPDDYVRQLSRDDRHAARAGAPEHAQDRRRADRDADGAARPHARARSLDPRQRPRRARRARDQLLPAHPGARRRAAEQLARRALALGAGHPAEDAARAQARAAPSRGRRSG